MPEGRIHFVGNTMIDTLLVNMGRLKDPEITVGGIPLQSGNYFVLTMHRPRNVDQESKLQEFMNIIMEGTGEDPVVFPVHPRTAKTLKQLGIKHPRLKLVEPLPYLEFNYLVKNARAVITDSGGSTEEASVMGVPCLTLRGNTERPETIAFGTNELAGTIPENLLPYLRQILNGSWKKGSQIPLWDGKAGDRIVSELLNTPFN